MPQNEHHEWPSFETVLRDVATSDDIRPREQSTSAVATMPNIETPAESPELPDDTPSLDEATDLIDLLPAPLPPLDIDTSAVRALLHQPEQVDVEPFALEALEPLETFEPIEPIEPTELTGPQDIFEPIETFDASEPPSVFDLAFDGPAFDGPAFDGPAFDEPAGNIFSGVSADSIDDLPSGAVFELDHDAIAASDEQADEQHGDGEPGHQQLAASPDPVDPGFTTASIDLFDLQLSDDEFDSVATANAIEGELNELNDLLPDFSIEEPDVDESENSLYLDNVVPLRTTSETVADGPPQTRVSHTGWVGLDEVVQQVVPAKEATVEADPWAHMRPTEQPAQEGFWAKVFGGEERKRAKARRRQAEQSLVDEAVPTAEAGEVAFDTACPNCGGECQLDLDDPIGRRVHVSCPACDHMWITPYLESEAG